MEQQNPLIKIGITLAIIAAAVGVVLAVIFGSKPTATSPAPNPAVTQPASPPPQTPVNPGTPGSANSAGMVQTTSPATPTTSSTAAHSTIDNQTSASSARLSSPKSVEPQSPIPPEPVTLTGLHVLPAPEARVATLGSVNPATGYKLLVDLSAWGGSVLHIRMADYEVAALSKEPLEIQSPMLVPVPGPATYLYPFAARYVEIGPNHDRVDLTSCAWQLRYPAVYRTTLEAEAKAAPIGPFDHAVYSTSIVDSQGRPVLDITRTYRLGKDKYDIVCEQEFINRTGGSLQVIWDQNIEGDMPADVGSYMGDVRKVTMGYFNPSYDPARQFVYTDNAVEYRRDIIKAYRDNKPLWPPSPKVPGNAELEWVAALNRYFTVVVHPPVVAGPTPGSYAITPFSAPAGPWDDLGLQVVGQENNDAALDTSRTVLTLGTKPLQVSPNQPTRLDLDIFAGPLKTELFEKQPYAALDLGKLVVYQLGSCTFCTFQPLAQALLWFTKLIHAITFDWGVAIIILVIVVRALLHPITRKAQINMMKMGKMQQQLAPELERLKKKYKDDQAAYNREMMGLYREKGVNPANMLGCLPMFLQMPIWFALYAVLFYAIELRQQPAFYGIFQMLSGGHWKFLADLSQADHFYIFSQNPIYPLSGIPLLGRINVSAINLLPILMGFMYYFQQKFATPTTLSATATSDQLAQQKMMKWMTVVIFPIMFYSMPSGLNLYYLASTGAGIVDSYLVRRHIRREEEENAGRPPEKPTGPKPGGLVDRLQKMLTEKQEQMQGKTRRNDDGSNSRPRK